MPQLAKDGQRPERFREGPEINIGDWVWVKKESKDDDDEGNATHWFACVTEIGSNYVKVESPRSSEHCGSSLRVHNDEIADMLTVEQDPEKVISEFYQGWQDQSRALMHKVQKVLENLGLRDRSLPAPAPTGTSALATFNKKLDVKRHKRALVKAKEKTLPKLFKEIEYANAQVAKWMSARTLPMLAKAKINKGVIKDIEDRVFTIELYAGLLEKVHVVREGRPSPLGTKLYIMQRRHYMDEECLVDYEIGGMEFSKIGQFDKWLTKKPQFDRILPFPRCMVAFQVRRRSKERGPIHSMAEAFIRMKMENADKLTYLYIRNGERLYRLSTDIEFPDKLFPDRDHFVLGDKMWAKKFGNRIDYLITDGEYQERLAEENEKRRKSKEWRKANPGKSWVQNLYSSFNEDDDIKDLKGFEPFDDTSVYYDEMVEKVEAEVKAHNKIAFIVQGLFDRSEVLHPHAQARLWTPEGFSEAVELVYDSDRALHASAEPPDFEKVRAKLNESLAKATVTVGQEDYWERCEAEKHNKREENNWRRGYEHRDVARYRPYGNPGPGLLAKIVNWQPRARKATYEWQRERQYSWGYDAYLKRQREPYIKTRITVPAGEILNCDAYEPGMYRQFYVDPRTRVEYLRWAPMLLAAEEYQAGNMKPGQNKRR